MLASSRHSAPCLINQSQILLLRRIELGRGAEDGERREAFIQQLVHDHPEIIPMADIEPAFMPMIPICRELETEAGFVDNLWLTPAGGIVIGECKLVRNPQARREVLSQALDYARAISGWHYEQLEASVRKTLKDRNVRLWDLVKDQTDLEENQFVDAVERRLRSSRFMVLIIGDGIQEGMEALTGYLQLHAGLHVGVALVDLSIWQGPDSGLLVVPRIPLRTVLVERGIVVMGDAGQPRITAAGLCAPAAASVPVRPSTASEPEFYEQLEQHRPGLPALLKPFVASLEGMGIFPEFRKTLILRWRARPDETGTFGYIDVDGRAWLGGGWGTAKRLGNIEAGERYLQEVADGVGGSIRRYEKSWPEVVGANGRPLEAAVLLSVREKWKAAIAALIDAIQNEPSEHL